MINFEPYCQITNLECTPLKLDFWYRNYLFIFYLCIYLFVYLSIHRLIYPFINLSIHAEKSLVRSSIYLSIHSFINPSLHTSIYSFIHLYIPSFIHLSIYSSISSFNRLTNEYIQLLKSIYSFV